MRIGINALYLVPKKAGGLETVLRNLLAAIAKIDNKNEYYLFTNSECSGTFETGRIINEVKCPVSGACRPCKHIWEQTIFPWWLKKYKIDVLLSPGNVAPLYSPCPSVSIINDAIPFIRPESFGLVEKIMLRILFRLTAMRSAAILTLSESAKREIVLHLGVKSKKVQAVYLAAEERFFPSIDNLDEVLNRHGIRKPYLICVASSRPYKNVGGLVRAFALLKERHSIPHQLVIIGLAGSAHTELLNIADVLIANSDIIFTGHVKDDELPKLYSGAIASVYPSFYEGFGLPLLESMACGTPVVSSNAASLPEVLGDAGILFDPHDIKLMSEAIFSVISDEGLRNVLREKGFERVKTFSWETSAGQIINILEEEAHYFMAGRRH
ncbi:MAG: glycosyltransferase family 4 protein [Nitrospirae bacterium]|nr:glycosyltransferase family 4 protein [Nitrospirota bacterium]